MANALEVGASPKRPAARNAVVEAIIICEVERLQHTAPVAQQTQVVLDAFSSLTRLVVLPMKPLARTTCICRRGAARTSACKRRCRRA